MSNDDTANRAAVGNWTYPTLGAAHAAAIGKIGTVSETGHNSFHRYAYATASDLSRAIRPVLAECGLSLTQIAVVPTREDGLKSAKGKPQWLTHVVVTYRLKHESGEFVDLQSCGTGLDGEDKGIYKAITGAFKYMLRTSFCVVVGEDPEDDRTPEQIAKQAHAEGRRGAIQALLRKGSHPTYSPQVFAKQLEEADAPKLADVRHFCVWAGIPKPSQRDDAARRKLITGLDSDAGRALWQQFKAECLPLRD